MEPKRRGKGEIFIHVRRVFARVNQPGRNLNGAFVARVDFLPRALDDTARIGFLHYSLLIPRAINNRPL